ncbi:hypothetical protein [Salinarimonas rosea]|uniref:hypothetical protein n=1 Tax=Salinarimonas rosea TaxID=552063 RepID=UPI000421B5D3|nr:hypothetical protein [Salinarimonas rosea]
MMSRPRRVSPAAAALALVALLAPLLAPAGLAAQGFDPMRPGGGGFNPMLPQGGAPTPPADDVPRNAEFGNLPDTPGMEDTFYLCSACHSLDIVTQQRMTDARWDYTWTWMVEEQGMAEMDEETKDLILSYLKRHFSSER